MTIGEENRAPRRRGSVSIEHVVIVTAVALAGTAGLSQVGAAFREDVSGDARSDTGEARGETLAATTVSVQAGVLGGLGDLADLGKNALRDLRDAHLRPQDNDGQLVNAVIRQYHDPETGIRLHINLPVDAKPKDGFAPILVLPGLGALAKYYETIPQILLEHGFAVALFDLPNQWDMSLAHRTELVQRGIDALATEHADVLDMSRLSVAGHSFGGGTALVHGSELGDSRIRRVVAYAPGVPPTGDDYVAAWAELNSGQGFRLPNRNQLLDEALSKPRADTLIIGSEFDDIVPKDRYAKAMASRCTGASCRYVEIPNAGHNNYADMPFPSVKVWTPSLSDPFRVRDVDLTALSRRSRTGASQRREAARLTYEFLKDLLPTE